MTLNCLQCLLAASSEGVVFLLRVNYVAMNVSRFDTSDAPDTRFCGVRLYIYQTTFLRKILVYFDSVSCQDTLSAKIQLIVSIVSASKWRASQATSAIADFQDLINTNQRSHGTELPKNEHNTKEKANVWR
jgi:hypothetical protein